MNWTYFIIGLCIGQWGTLLLILLFARWKRQRQPANVHVFTKYDGMNAIWDGKTKTWKSRKY